MEILKVTKDLQRKFPASLRDFFKDGSNLTVWRSDDALMLKQIRRPAWPSERPSRQPPMTLEEIDREVHAVRRRNSQGKR